MTKTIVRKKYLVSYSDDNEAKVVQVRTCDCFLDSILHFKKNMVVLKVDIQDDVFLIFAKKSVVCFETALYQFDYRKFICHDKMYDECLAYEIECNCLYLLEKKLSCFNALCSNCKYNLIKMVSNRFIKIKNDKN